tara:strand:- start:241 stop:858 length:618 start_codon:yes stop_codon:yes gene_type:complete
LKLRLLILIIVLVNTEFYSQDSKATKKPVFKKSNLEFNFTQNTASLLTPSLRVIHPGINGTLSTQWNKHNKLQLRQDFIAGFFYHKSFQSVIQLYSELNFKIKALDRFYLSPLVMGGGYFISFLNMQSFYWDGNQYVSRAITMKSNWVISLGSNLEFPTDLKIFNRPLNITAKYRIQVQGVIVRYNVPIIAYSPIMVGISLPVNN